MAKPPAPTSPAVSIVITFFNEEGGLEELMNEISAAMSAFDFETIAVNDGSNDATAAILENIAKSEPRLRVLHHEQNVGKSRAVRTGVLAARASVIATLDGDGQNDPADIPPLLEKLNGDVVLVAGERIGRKGAASRKMASRFANGLRRRVLRDGAADTGCGLKAFYREAFLRLPYFDNCHRYVPALMRREGFEVAYAPVKDRPRAHGQSKYTNLGRFFDGIFDLCGVMWLIARSKNPNSIHESRE